MDDPVGDALRSRCMPHSRAKGKSRGSGKASKPFNPLVCLGRYEVQLASGSTIAEPVARWEIHELTEDEQGLVGTFDFSGRLSGIFIMAGSRKGLASIVDGLDSRSDESLDGESSSQDEKQEQDPSILTRQSSLEAEDEKINRRARAFEKNSFRNPKFWLRWKARVTTSDQSEPGKDRIESDMGYLVFSGNDCQRFEGSITCQTIGWDNVKLRGRKAHSRPTPCPLSWTDFGRVEDVPHTTSSDQDETVVHPPKH